MEKSKSPEALHQALAKAFNSKDVNNLIALYESNGSLIPEPDKLAEGTEQLRNALSNFLSIDGDMEVKTTYVVQNKELALTRSSWKITKDDTLIMAASGTELMRKQADNHWLFVIDHPFGGV